MGRTIKWLLLLCVFISGLTACHQKDPKDTIRVGTIAGPETQLMKTAQHVALNRYGLHIIIVPFSDYTMPNDALNNGIIDANMFQHIPYLEAQTREYGYKIVSVGKTFIYPMGVYSKKITRLSQLQEGATVAIPNDPSNRARALLLLQQGQLIQLNKNSGFNVTLLDITKNPKQLHFVEWNASELPRALDSVDLAAINTNYAIPAGLSPKRNALIIESARSPYANIVAVREENKNDPRVKKLVAALHSKQVLVAAQRIFGEEAVAAW
ncbi:MAG: hypothetical protein A3F41_01970 [Coxiella sp. RIFCSPHIGHO2_12_FULL_44_14]|nr:MAG: hypothetical protein A3F41_01970 [Coxiella sp. RIFCSPHIGHO2_12_FULL_44_14]